MFKVNQLTWQFFPSSNVCSAEWLARECINGRYFRVFQTGGSWQYGPRSYTNDVAAKRAAQADFDAAVRGCIDVD